jgi:hypothetical protein
VGVRDSVLIVKVFSPVDFAKGLLFFSKSHLVPKIVCIVCTFCTVCTQCGSLSEGNGPKQKHIIVIGAELKNLVYHF